MSELEAVKQIAAVMEKLTAREREEAFYQLRSLWCEWCGSPQPLHGFCQCMNDE
jgi:hypothetical protein